MFDGDAHRVAVAGIWQIGREPDGANTGDRGDLIEHAAEEPVACVRILVLRGRDRGLSALPGQKDQ